MCTHRDTTPTNRTAFTLTEMLVVISLAVLFMGTLLPAVSSMRQSNQVNSAVQTIGVAATAARAYATGNQPDMKNNGNPAYPGFTHSGAAVIFTPAGELRLVENDQLAVDGNGNPLEPTQNGYADIPDRNNAQLPNDAGVVGIARGTNGPPYLLTPPFAVRYNEHGHLISAVDAGDRVVYYDGDYDGKFQVTTTRSSGYDPDDWDTIDELQFEELETVIGVMVYSKDELRAAGFNHAAGGTGNPINASAHNWILQDENSQTILFGRYTGTMIRK